MMDTPAMRFLKDGTVVLYEFKETWQQFFWRLLKYLFIAPVLWWLAVAIVAVLSTDPLYWFLHPLPILAIYGFLAFSAWRAIGERRVVLDGQLREMVREETWPNRVNAPVTTRIPFSELLLTRHWRAAVEGEPAAFVLSVHPSSSGVGSADLDGYVLHVELAQEDTEKVGGAVSALAEKIVAATGLRYMQVESA